MWLQAITTESVLRTHLQLRTRKLTETQNIKVRKINDERRAAGKDKLSEQEVADVFDPKLADADLWARCKLSRAFAGNVIGPAFLHVGNAGPMTFSAKEMQRVKIVGNLLL